MVFSFDAPRSSRKPEDPLLGRLVSKHPCISGSSVTTCLSCVRTSCKPEIDLLDPEPEPSFDAEPGDELDYQSDSISTTSWFTSTTSWLFSATAESGPTRPTLLRTKSTERGKCKDESAAFLAEFQRRRACFNQSTRQSTIQAAPKQTLPSWLHKALSLPEDDH
ncbi:unnamed protein product [Durusdinium trenchii]|uniref:Uncharacterized protein n=2 Tax=Durusdinium trenchii TaxID=1381693 RepID=A0ABP0L4I8_9DINO